MHTSRLAGIAFGMFWLILLVVSSSAMNQISQLAVYALLVAFIGFRRARVIQWDDGSATMKALTFGAAISFGPAGGAIVGAISVFAQSMDKHTEPSVTDMAGKTLRATLAGMISGFAFAWIGSQAQHQLLVQSFALAVAAIAYLSSSALFYFLMNSRRGFASAVKRTVSDQTYSSDLVIGIVLAALAGFLYQAFALAPIMLAFPSVYLARQLFGEKVPSERAIVPEKDGQLGNVYMSAMQALVTAIDARDRFTRMHTTNVVSLATSLGRRMGLSEDELEGIETAALFHDIGKLWVPEHILLKPGKLDQKQFAKIQCHPALGQRILDSVEFPWAIGEVVRSHHERWDGAGYPDHLKGDEIPLGARILCLADVFDAMISKRLYRPSNDMEDTLRYIRGAAGTHFDPAVVQALDEIIADGDLPDVYRNSASALKVVDGLQSSGHPAEDISVMGSEFVAVFEIAQTAGTTLELDQVLGLLADKIKSLISCSTCAIFLCDPDSSKLQSTVVIGDNTPYFQGAVATLGRGQTGMVAETGRGIIADYDGRDLANPTLQKSKAALSGWVTPQSVMIVPIATANANVIGTINLYQTNCAFSEEDLLLLNAVAPEVGKAIQKALLYRETSESAVTDVITGLHNARYLATRLDEELMRAKCTGGPVTIMCMDVDNFKTVNDVLGHQQGDVVLREMADIFRHQVRERDLVCRYGGDEFIIVLPGTDRMEALMTKRRIEVQVDGHALYGSGDKQVGIGVSIGIATYPDNGQDAKSLIAVADANMYTAKRRRKANAAAA